MVFEHDAADAFGHKKLGGIGDLVSEQLKELSAKYNHGKTIDVINQKLAYLVRCGDPDAIDSVVPMAYGNLALDLVLRRVHGRLVVLKHGRYDNMPIDVVTSSKKVVNVKEHYNTDRLRPHYHTFEMKPLFIMTSDVLEKSPAPAKLGRGTSCFLLLTQSLSCVPPGLSETAETPATLPSTETLFSLLALFRRGQRFCVAILGRNHPIEKLRPRLRLCGGHSKSCP